MEFLRSFLRRHFARKPVVTSENLSCLLRLQLCCLLLLMRWDKSPALYTSEMQPSNVLHFISLKRNTFTTSIYHTTWGVEWAFGIEWALACVTSARNKWACLPRALVFSCAHLFLASIARVLPPYPFSFISSIQPVRRLGEIRNSSANTLALISGALCYLCA